MSAAPFRTQAEADAYTLLHTDEAAFEARYGRRQASEQINDWETRKLVRITYPDGYTALRTFKKYAGLTGLPERPPAVPHPACPIGTTEPHERHTFSVAGRCRGYTVPA